MPKYFLILLLSVPVLGAQTTGETILQSYERVFIRSNLNTKVNVLSDAAEDEAAALFYGPLCATALRFVTENASLFRDDPDMLNVTVIAVRGVGEYAYNPAAEILWQVFLQFPDNTVRYEILDVLFLLDASSIAEKIAEFLEETNRRYNSGLPPDYQILSALFTILGRAGNDASYPALFASSLVLPEHLKKEAMEAFYKIDGDLTAFLLGVIIHNPPAEKLFAFRLALDSDAFSKEEKGTLAEAALEAALLVPGDRRSEIRDLAGESLVLIGKTEWIRALPHVLKYYNQHFIAFGADLSAKQPLLSAISCLGFLRSTEAARTLALQLGIYNSRYSTLGTEEQEVVLAIINSLGQLGYKAAYDTLHYAGIIPYPEEITEAARKALAMLKW